VPPKLNDVRFDPPFRTSIVFLDGAAYFVVKRSRFGFKARRLSQSAQLWVEAAYRNTHDELEAHLLGGPMKTYAKQPRARSRAEEER
jgi:hypothetical protein